MNSLKKTVLILVAAVSVLFSGCKDDAPVFNAAAQFEKEVAEIDAYLESNSIAHIKDPNGLRIVPTLLGTKLPAQSLSTIDVTYKGKFFSSGTVFEEGTATGFLSGFIPGWQIAMRKLPVGSQASIYIPSYFAYGQGGSGKIPGNSTLVFDVTINSATHSTVFNDKFKSDTTAINTYVANKGLTVVKDPTGVRYISQLEGTGATPSWFTPVKVKYSFTLLSNDSNVVGTYERGPADGFSSFVVDYIQGVQVALQKMKVGGKMRLFLPSGLAFGIENAIDASGVVVVPANSNVIVDLELLEVK